MSYTTRLRPPKPHCEACGSWIEDVTGPDPTYNLSPIFHLALTGETETANSIDEVRTVLFGPRLERPWGLRVLDEKTGRDSLELLTPAAWVRMADPALRPAFLKLQPENGWGTFEGAIKVILQMETLAKQFPGHVWWIR